MVQTNQINKKQNDPTQLTQLTGLAKTSYDFSGKGNPNPNPPAQAPSGMLNIPGSQELGQNIAPPQDMNSNMTPRTYDPNSTALERYQKKMGQGANI